MVESCSVGAILTTTDRTLSSIISSTECSMTDANKQSGELGNRLDKSTTEGNQLSKSILSIGVGVGTVKLISTTVDMAKGSAEGATGRFDTLNKYPMVTEVLGYSTRGVDRPMGELSNRIGGLPTSLDKIVADTQQLSASAGSLSKGASTAVALDDTFLVSRVSAADAVRDMQRYVQMPDKDKVDMQF